MARPAIAALLNAPPALQWVVTLALALNLLMPATAARAATPIEIRQAQAAAEDHTAIRTVIEAQLAALAADDAARAFSYASPAIRAMFETPARFLNMVRQGYPVVHRPASVQFLAPREVEGQVLQGVRLTDAQGRPWLAMYQMQRQPDGQWRINGCQVAQGESLQT